MFKKNHIPEKSSINLNSNRSIFRNTLWNLTGYIAPLLAAIISIPLLIKDLGVDRFGILTLAWMVIGYFSLFDFGLGRTLTKFLSEKLGEHQATDIPELVWTALSLMGLLGIIGAGVTLILTEWLVISVLNIPHELQAETLKSFQLLAWSIPLVILTTGMKGILESYQRFDLINIVRIPLGLLTFLSPLAVLPFSNQLDKIVLALLLSRILFFIIHIFLCKKIMVSFFWSIKLSQYHLKKMLRFGGWMTVSNIIGPMMIYIDRFIIGSLFSMRAVTYYVTPYEIITKLLIIPNALVNVLFPKFSENIEHKRMETASIFHTSVHWILLSLFPLVLLAIIFATNILELWLSEDFAINSSIVLQCLAAGVLFNGLASIPFAFIQGIGHPHLTAKLHFIELPFYLIILWLLVSKWGIVGAAIAWLLRNLVDMCILFIISIRLEKHLQKFLKSDILIIGLLLIIMGMASSLEKIENKIIFSITIIPIYYTLAWNYFSLGNFKKQMINKIYLE